MGVIPMKEDCGQEIYTRDHGVVKVDKNSWQDGRFHVVLCPNGAYQHINGLPIKEEEELVEAFGSNTEDLEKALNWFRNRHDLAGKAPRKIEMHPDGYPVFEDGTVADFDDLYAYFRPGKGLTGMIVALQDYKDRAGAAGPPKELRKAAPPSAETVTEPAPKAAPPAENRLEAYKAKERARHAKTRAAKKAAKEAQPAPAPAQG
jgi:hypothetical protein